VSIFFESTHVAEERFRNKEVPFDWNYFCHCWRELQIV